MLHKLTAIIGKSIGYIYSPFSRKSIHFADVEESLKLLLPGDFIIIRTRGELSTLVIPGFYKHAAIYVGGGKIIDATKVGVSERYLADLLMETDNFALLRVPNLTEDQRSIICSYAHSMIGTPYDFEVNINTKSAIFCSELIYYAVNYALQKEYFDLRERMGVKTLTPQDLRDATKKIDIILEK